MTNRQSSKFTRPLSQKCPILVTQSNRKCEKLLPGNLSWMITKCFSTLVVTAASIACRKAERERERELAEGMNQPSYFLWNT